MADDRLQQRVREFWKRVGSPDFAYDTAPEATKTQARCDSVSESSCSHEADFDVTIAIDRLSASGLEETELRTKYLDAGVPVIVTGAVDDWKAYQHWDYRFFQQQYGHLSVFVDIGNGERQKVKLEEYINFVEAYPDNLQALAGSSLYKPGCEEVPYLRLWHVEEQCPELREEYEIPGWFDDYFEKLPKKFRPYPTPHWVFIGPQDAHTPLHLDPWCTHAWFAQLQ
ncbi:hypothetical protein CYMTET_23461, partial [Cymbomonas tetramitiformis]